jgi:hypothetical protein
MKLEDRVDRTERKIKTVEKAIIILTELNVQHSSLLEKIVFDTEELKAGQRELQEGNRELQEKINILIDAQIRTEDKSQQTDEKMQILEQKMAELADVVKLAHQRIDKIEEN